VLTAQVDTKLKVPLKSSPAYRKTSEYQVIVERLLDRKYMTYKQVYRILKREYNYPLSYSSFKRYINIRYPEEPLNYLRIEVKPGEEAQVDFGSAGKMVDPATGRLRRAYAFIMTLSCSRIHYLRKVLALFRLGDKYGKDALNLTCKRALHYEDYRMNTIKRILNNKFYLLPLEDEAVATYNTKDGLSFVRPVEYFIHTKEVR